MKEKIQMANKHMKKDSIFFISEIQIKTKLHDAPMRAANI